jgi:hypothetical protein
MIQLRPHNSLDYVGLPDIDQTSAGVLSAEDYSCLGEVGYCLVEEHANERFGATLLHSHFPVRDDEILVEEAHANSQLIMLRPVARTCHGLVATSVCFDEASDPFRLIGLEFTSEDALATIRSFGEDDRDVLTHLREILYRHGKVGRFGVRLLNDPLELGGRVLLETCDPVGRVLSCRTTSEDDPAFVEAIPTLFQWEAGWDNGNLTIGQGCMQFCKRVKRCALSRNGHQPGSSSHDTSHEGM